MEHRKGKTDDALHIWEISCNPGSTPAMTLQPAIGKTSLTRKGMEAETSTEVQENEILVPHRLNKDQ